MDEADGLLLLPRLRVQNANAISGPLSWGFPSPTAFLGFAHALERRLKQDWDLQFTGVGIVCHHFEPLTSRPAGRRHQVFRLSRHPVRAGYKKYEGKDAALVEEGRAHFEVSLLLETEGDLDDEPQEFLSVLLNHIHSMRLAGGSILPAYGEAHQPQWQPIWDDEENNQATFRSLRRNLLPGFAVVQRTDLLTGHLDSLKEQTPDATTLDALLDLTQLNVEPETDKDGNTHWQYRSASGWLVPLPVGYAAISDVYPPGEVANTRDNKTSFCFVESLYSLGQWISPHRIDNANSMMWRYQTKLEQGLYLCANDYETTITTD